MDEVFVTEKVFEEYAQRVEKENQYQDERLAKLEKSYDLINNLYVSMERLASNVETMAKELTRQGNCLRDLEMKPAKKWDLVISTAISGIVGLIIGLLSSGLIK